MNVRVRFFASLRELVGYSEKSIALTDGSSVDDLWKSLCEEHPRLLDYTKSVSFAVNQEYVVGGHSLQPGDEVAFIPPVSGG